MKIIDKNKEINEIINKASTVFVTGHKDIDLDALGAGLAIYNYVQSVGKEVSIILDDVVMEAAVDKAIHQLKTSIRIITSEKAAMIKNSDSLLIIVDTNKKNLLQAANIDENFEQKIVIDHHETGENTINDGLIIVDKEASSTCEMLTDFLKFNNYVIDGNLATILLSGIILDTNNYVLKTDSNTFYCSYYLTTCGADPSRVQYLLKQDLKKYIKRQKMISNAKILKNVAVTKGETREIYRKEELAKTADSLLLFNEIEASFVVAKIENNVVGISARSMGNINVGKILVMFGGGGDINFAAAKIEGTTVNKVTRELLRLIKLL